MQILITHLTRMAQGYACIAGQNIESDETVRPVLPKARWARNETVAGGGIIGLGNVIDFGAATPVGEPPETEDHEVGPGRARLMHAETAVGFWETLERSSQPSLREIFGSVLYTNEKGRAVVDPNEGERSLGILAPRHRPSISTRTSPGGNEQLRVELFDPDLGMLNLPVTDLRYYDRTYQRVVKEHEMNARAALRSETVLMSVGLGRPFAPTEGEPRRHYLQVNNLHFGDDPLWSPWN